MLLTELFELYHRTDISDDYGQGIDSLVGAARAAGLCYEPAATHEDHSFDPETEWRKWGKNEERKRYHLIMHN
jgi:hypothetical protein